jgi:hypothetical protein
MLHLNFSSDYVKYNLTKTLAALFISVSLATILTPETGFCSWLLTSDFGLTIPNVFVDQEMSLITKKSSGMSFTLPDQSVNLGITVNLFGISTEITNLNTTSVTIDSGKKWQLSATGMQAEIDVGRIDANQVIDQVVNGVRLRLRLNASCSGIRVILAPNVASAMIDLSLSLQNGAPLLNVDKLSLSWPQNAWQVVPFSCTGAAGFDQAVTTQVTQFLSSPATFQVLLQAHMQANLNNKFLSTMAGFFSGINIDTKRSDFSVFAKAISFSAITGGYQLLGKVNFLLPFVAPGQTLQESLPPLPVSMVVGTVTNAFITLPDSILQKLLTHIQDTQILNRAFTSNEVPPLTGLLNSRFQQFFVFPDLMKFPKKSVFNFVAGILNPITLVNLSTSRSSKTSINSNPGFDAKLSGVAIIQAQAPMKGQSNASYIPYVNFATQVKSDVNINITDSQLSFVMNNASVKIKTSWDQDYVSLYKPDQRIWTSLIAGKIKGTLVKKPLTYQLPFLNLSALGLFQAASLNYDSKNSLFNITFTNAK